MLLAFKKIFSALILPPTSLVLLTFLGLWLTRKHPKAGRTLATLSLTILLILSLPITGNALLHSLETAPPISESQLKAIQAIVILGGGKDNEAPEFGNHGTVNRWTLQRLRYGAYLQKLTGSPILLSGGSPFDELPEAAAMADTLRRDFQTKDLWIEDQSRDTEENAVYSARILKQHDTTRIALITQAWHVPRALMFFKKQGITAYPASTGYTNLGTRPIALWLPDASALENSSIAIKEYIAIAMVAIRF